MAREQFQTLTEPMYYILIALSEECCGVDIMEKVQKISGGRVKVGPGTLYTMLSKFEENQIIFRTKEEVEAMIEADELLEYAQYVENYYGTPRSYVEEMLSKGKNVILEIEIQGAMKIKEKIPDTVLIFVTPPTIQELKDRLVGRGTETQEVIESRLKRASEEAEGIESYDYLLVNDVVEDCVDELHEIILSERRRASRNEEFIRTIQKESREFFN